MFRAAHEGRESARVAHTPPLLAADLPANELFAVKNMSPEKMLTISGASVQSSWRYLPTTRDIHEPTAYHVGIAGGIVKHGGAIGRVLERTGGPYALYRGKGQDEGNVAFTPA